MNKSAGDSPNLEYTVSRDADTMVLKRPPISSRVEDDSSGYWLAGVYHRVHCNCRIVTPCVCFYVSQVAYLGLRDVCDGPGVEY